MKIRMLNPVYDSVFKILLDNIFIAKGIISRITGETIKELTALPSERTKDVDFIKKYKLPIYSLDYVALVETKQGKNEHIVIEMQKSAITPHLQRFREYLGEEFRRKVPVKQKDGIVKETYLPITTIYFIEKPFNSKLPPILLADKKYFNVLKNEEFTEDPGELVKCLTNKAYFIQNTNLPHDLKNELEFFRSFSNEFVVNTGDDRVLEIPYEDIDGIKDPLYREMVKTLMTLIGNKELRKQMKTERIYESFIEKIEAEMNKKEKQIKQKEIEIKAEKEKNKQKEQQFIKTVKLLRKYGMSDIEIANETDSDIDEISELK